MRPPLASIAFIVANAARPTMKYSGSEMPVFEKSFTSRLGATIAR